MTSSTRNSDPCTSKGCKWKKDASGNVNVPVFISRAYSRSERNTIIRALLSFHNSTSIRFIRWRWGHRNFLYFFSGNGCWSYVGRQAGGQRVSLQRNGCVHTGIIQHEVLHALGFHHEQTRSDRDQYVEILYENILPGRENNFQKVETNNLGTPYDFNSVMHYSKYAFSKNGQPTIIAKSDPDKTFGQRVFMSDNDIERVNRLYECNTSSPQTTRPPSSPSPIQTSTLELHTRAPTTSNVSTGTPSPQTTRPPSSPSPIRTSTLELHTRVPTTSNVSTGFTDANNNSKKEST